MAESNPLSAGYLALSGTLLVAGVIHLALVPEHLAESLALGLGFIGSGLAQVAFTAVLLRWRSSGSLRLALGVSAVSLVALVLAVTIGLPLLAHGESMGVLGPVEGLDDLAALTGLVELVSIVVAIRLLRADSNRASRGTVGAVRV